MTITEIELVYHSPTNIEKQPRARNSQDMYDIFMETWPADKIDIQEHFRIAFIKGVRCIGVSTVATGGMSGCLVDLRLVFAMALKAGASGIVLAHNHPSGRLIFSPSDIDTTAEFVAASAILRIPTLDHLVVTKESYISMRDLDLMPLP